MNRYILRCEGEGAHADEVAARVRALPEATVLDVASPRMLLVEGSAAAIDGLVAELPGWTASPERSIPLPEHRPEPREAVETDELEEPPIDE